MDSNGEVRLLQSLSHSGKSYNAHIHISDNGSPSKSVQETIQLSVVDEKDGNLSLGQSTKTLSVDESSPIGTRIGSVASRTSGGSRYSYTMVTSNVHVEKSILVDKLRGDLIVIGKLNADKVPEFNFDIRVVNLDGDTSPSSVTVRITVNQKSSVRAPRFTENPSRVDVAESARVGTRVVNLEKLTSNDSNSRNVNFEIVDQTPGDAFKLEPNSGQLVVARNLDYEQVEEYLVTVRGFSGEKFSADLSVVVSVKDVNDNRPKFWSSDTISLSPDTPLETTFMKLVVSDEDTGQNGEVITTIVAGNYENIFQLDPKTHELKLSKPLTSKTFELTIRAEDMAEQSLYTTQDLTILVTTGDDSSPRFEKSVYYAQITENSSPDSKVLTVALNRNGRYIYSLLKGEDRFYIDERSGDVKTVSSLDREEEETHALIVSVHDEDNAGITDTAVVYVTVDDVNDNAPEFGHNCRDISIPENSQHSFVHAFVASDRDSGDNGEISYSLKSVSQQFSNKFRIEKDTGKLFSMPLDREEQQDYRLEIIAVDHGAGRLTTKCELTIKVIDENDNSPSFSQSIYSASVKEDIARDTEVLKVLATDADSGDNAKVLYSIENASHWSFSIDKNTGRIFTTAALDREAVDEIRFDVLATDKGEHNIRSSRTKVKIIVTDANDHKPEFTEYPFKINMTATPSSGVSLLKLTALDPDIGPNGQLAYNLVRPEQRNRFHLSPEEGILAVASTEIAWEPGTVETLEVAVSDAGNPPRSSTGLIEIKIEGGPAINLEFEEELYSAEIQENPQSGQDVTQVKAVRSDGRRQRVIYTFLRGNELGAFEINSNNGLIRVRAPELVDYEQQTEFNLTISGQGLGDDELTAYTTCVVKVKDINDQAPKFNREVYNTKIPEGSNKGTEVVVLTATDQDVSETKPLRYDIIDGNLDGAFTVDPNKPGVILTNIVLDREIKDMYELTVSVTDSGTPPLVGLTQLVVKVIDTNDNKPHFGFIPPIEVESDTVPGSVVYVLRANDIDIAPAVTYKLERPNKFFIVDTYTGQLLLLRHPRQDEGKKTSFVVLASDTQHEVEAKVTVTFKQSELTCKPEFSDPLYTFYASLNDTFPKGLGEIEVTSCNEHELSVARKDRSYFNILTNGTLVLNRLPREDITSILITATDRVSDEKTSAVVTLSKNEGTMAPIDLSEVFPDTIKFSSSTLNGPVLMQKASEFPTEDLVFSITENPIFQIDSKTGSIFQVFKKSSVDNVPKDLTVTAKRLSDNMIKTKSLGVIVDGHSSGLKPDHFTLERVTTTLEEDAKINTQIDICSFTSHSAGTPFIKIVSGNEGQTFLFDEDKAKLILNKPLDFEAMDTRSIVLKMGSNGKFSLCTVIILVTNVNDFVPYFPITEFVTSIPENSPVGSPIKAPPLVDLDPNDRLIFWTRSSKFHVNSRTGEISTREVFDYEDVSDHYLDLYVNDTAGHLSQCRVQVMVESQDEFPPIFEQNNYYFSIPGLASVGDIVGQVKAQDRDQGADGYVSYSFTTSNQYLSIDSARGVVTVSKELDTGIFSNSITGNALSNRRRKRAIRDLRVVVNAKSKQPHSLESSTLLTISVEAALLPVAVDPSAGMSSMVLGILVGFVIIIIVLLLALLWFCKRKQDREKEARKMALLAHNASAASAHGDRRGGQTNMAMELNSTASSSDALSRFPPQYSEIVSDYESRTKMKTNRSEISEKSHRSASSGRGSVEDGEEEVDVEIRMINEGSFLPPDSSYAMDAEDKMSEGSVQNTEEYLARLGIDMRKPPNMNSTAGGSTTGGGGDMVHNFDNNYTVGGGGPGSSIYNRIPDDTMSEKSSVMNAKQHSLIYGSRGQPSIAGSLSSIVHSEEELAGSYNWDYLLDWGPQYQPLAHVFKEISKLKDDEGPSPGPATQSAVMSVAATTPGSGGSMLSAEASGGNSGMPYGITGVKKNPRTSHLLLPRSTRSPISHDMLSSQNALSPNFHPALSPLATKSPSVSPLSVPNLKGGNRGPVVHHQRL